MNTYTSMTGSAARSSRPVPIPATDERAEATSGLVMSEESRLGREAIETTYTLKQLVQAGVRVFFYLEDRERTLDSPTDKLLMSVTAFADELELERLPQPVRRGCFAAKWI